MEKREESEREVDRIYANREKTPNTLMSGEKEQMPAR
jgi:hypothetical protein